METTLLINLVLCAIMVGLIWTVQLIVYPSYRFVTDKDSKPYHSAHMRNIGFLVGPIMIAELIAAIWLFTLEKSLILFAQLFLVLLIWISTAVIQAPLHKLLSENWESIHINKLVRSNWVRTFLWSLRLSLLFYLSFQK